MKDEEIKAEMEKYTEALKQKFKGFDYDPDDEEKKAEFFRQAKENAHKVAIECLNKILTPELKIFIINKWLVKHCQVWKNIYKKSLFRQT